MIPGQRDIHPHVADRSAWAGDRKRGHLRAGLQGSTALTDPRFLRYKGGGGFMGIFKSVVVGAVLGAVTGGAGFGLGFTTGASVFGLSAGLSSAIASGAAMGALGGLLSGAAGAIMGGPKTGGQQQVTYEAHDNKLTVRNSTAPRKKIYGTAFAAGTLIYATSTGGSHDYMHLVTPLASHQVAAIREIYFNNRPASDARFNGFYRINKHLGTQTQVADPDLVAESGGEWTAAHRARGTAYLYPRLKYDTNAWVSGLPSASAMVDGALYYDPRSTPIALVSSSIASPGIFTTAAAHGLGPGDIVFIRDHLGATYAASNGATMAVTKAFTVDTVPTSSTFTLLDDSGTPMPVLTAGIGGTVTKCGWSNNSALAILDFLLSRDGINCGTEEINWPVFADAASLCDQSVDLGTAQTFTVSSTSDQLTLAQAVGWTTGTQIYVSSSTTLPAPLAAATAYFWIESGTSQAIGLLAASYADALAGTQVNLTDEGAGTHTASVSTSVTLSASADTVTLASTSTAIETGDGITLTGTLAGTDYYWINTDYLQGKLATSRAGAMAGTAIEITADETARLTRKNQARYTTNGVIDLAKKPIDILNELLTACGGVLVFTQGKYRLFPAAATTSVRTLDEDDLRGPVRIVPHSPRSELINAVRGTYKEPAKYWEMTDFPPITSSVYEDEDGGQRLYKDIALPHTIDAQRAQRIASIALGRGRRGMTVTFPATVKLLGISAWDGVSLNLTSGGNSILTNKKFRVTSWVLAEDGAGIDLSLQEEDDAIYAWSPEQGSLLPQNNLSNLPSPWIVAPPAGLSVQSGTGQLSVAGDGTVHSRALLTWTAPADAFVAHGGMIEVQYKRSSNSTWTAATPVPGPQTSTFITDVDDGVAYDFRVRSKNTLGAVSDADGAAWSAMVENHVVIGKSAPPANVTGFSAQPNGAVVTFRWASVPDSDLSGYELRYATQGTFVWSSATVLTQATRGTLITNAGLPPGNWTVGIKAKDTSQNESLVEETYDVGVANTNAIVSSPAQGPSWLGTLSGFIRHDVSGRLVPDSTRLANALDWEVFDQFVPDPVATAIYTAPEVIFGFDVAAVRVWASVAAALGPGTTGAADPLTDMDSHLFAGAYGGFAAWSVGTVPAAALQQRARIETATGVAYLDQFTPTIDIAARDEGPHTVTLSATGGTPVTFPSRFLSAPGIQVSAAAVGGDGRVATYESVTPTGFTARVFVASTGAETTGNITYTATGAG